MDSRSIQTFVDKTWDESVLPALREYIAVPALSPHFDPDWEKTGHIDRAMKLIETWCRARPIRGMKLEVVKLPGRTPLLFGEIPGDAPGTVFLYGHMDKQPEMTGWSDGLGPWSPVVKEGKLYGRGGADDGYAAFAALTAVEALQKQGGAHARCILFIEGSEESGSPDLPFYIEHLSQRIGTPSLIVCLDSGAGNFEQLWATTSLRGIVTGSLHVSVLGEGVHSGSASGIVPSSFRVIRQLLSRIEDEQTGEILVRDFHADVPDERLRQIHERAHAVGDAVYREFPMLPGMNPVTADVSELILNNTWRPALSIVGVDGLPTLGQAGNVLRPRTSLKLSLRLPPSVNAEKASARLKEVLEKNPPYGARVTFEIDAPGNGWNAPATVPWLAESVDGASRAFFGKPARFMGEGGSIPFMAMLGERYPKAQFLITGVLGPGSNAHGPNEFLHLPMAKRLTACVARVIADSQAE